MVQPAVAPGFPGPYLQPDRRNDCGYYTAAYIARCLGHPAVTASQVKAWRAETRKHETHYATDVLGAQTRRFWDMRRDDDARRIFWLGPAAKEWARGWLAAGWVAHVNVHRIPDTGHAVALLAAGSEGVLLHDPVYGHVTEPWEWFLGPGPRGEGEPFSPGRCCHFVEGWYRAASARAQPS